MGGVGGWGRGGGGGWLRAVEWVDDEDSDVSVFAATFQSRGCNMNFAFETKTLASEVITLGV